MKVLLINRAMPIHNAGGLESHVEDLALGLAASGCEIHLLTAPLPEAERERLARKGVVTHVAPGNSPNRYIFSYLRRIGERIEDLIARHRFDLIHGQEFALGFWRPRVGGVPLILSVHGTITSETPLHRDCRQGLNLSEKIWAWGRFGRRYLFGPIWRRQLRAASRILVDSTFTQRELESIIPDSRGAIRHIPLGVRLAGPMPPSFKTARQELGWEGLRLLTLGRIEWQKGQSLAVEALAGLRGMDWHYTIAGEGSRARQLEKQVRRLRLEKRVTLVGRLTQEQKRLMLAGADLFVWPERTHPAFGLVGLEALLHETPVLGTPRGAIPEVIGKHGGWIATDATVGALQEALEPVMKTPTLLRDVRGDLRTRALKRFSYEAMIEATLVQYRAVSGCT